MADTLYMFSEWWITCSMDEYSTSQVEKSTAAAVSKEVNGGKIGRMQYVYSEW